MLVSRGMVRLVVIDSIAALFRCEFAAKDSVLKAKYLQIFGAKLHKLSSKFRVPVVCINQVKLRIYLISPLWAWISMDLNVPNWILAYLAVLGNVSRADALKGQ